MRYNTGNPVGTDGSSDPRDLYDNAGIFDLLLSGPLGEYLNRLGVPLKSWLGIMQQVTDYLIDQGYESVYLTYGAGVVVERQTQLVQRAGELYRVMSASDIPLALTGTWATDAPKLQAVGDAALRQALASTAGPDMIGFDPDLAYAPTSAGYQLKGWYVVSADGSGAADAAPAINAALARGGRVFLPKPAVAYLINSPLNLTVNGTVLAGAGMTATAIKKGFNGEAITLTGRDTEVRDLWVQGESASYTGGGIKPIGYSTLVYRCRVTDTADSPVVFNAAVTENNFAGTYCLVDDCFLLPADLVNGFAIRSLGVDAPTRPTVRTFRNIHGGGPLVDFSGMNYVVLNDSLGTNLKFSVDSQKVNIRNVRITAGTNVIDVLGVDHVLDGNTFGFSSGGSVRIAASAANVHWGATNIVTTGSSTMQSPTILAALPAAMPNNIHGNLVDWLSAFLWGGSTSNAVLGNSTVSAYYKLSGRQCYVSFSLLRGSTATNPVGTWSIRLPFKAFVTSVHPVLIKSSSGAFSNAILEIQGSSTSGVLYLNGASAPMTEASLAFGTGALIEGTLNYLVSPA